MIVSSDPKAIDSGGVQVEMLLGGEVKGKRAFYCTGEGARGERAFGRQSFSSTRVLSKMFSWLA